ncbi:glucans biosynthesis glucosyltransferase MdoH [Schlegelella aquatica]|uniref:glucans biosynthesis glucosyltransferase MdoH n=1 Tax=Caldimonas aquatica TaxID=376175 RepID=UPI003753E29E
MEHPEYHSSHRRRQASAAYRAGASAPPLHRGSMPAQPWRGFARGLAEALLRVLTGRTLPRAVPQTAWERAALARRRVFMALILSCSVAATLLMAHAQPAGGDPWLKYGQLALFGLLFAWVSAGFITALMGFMVQLGGDPHSISRRDADGQPLSPDARTAIVMPICNEHVPTVFAGLRATCESLAATGAQHLFDVFVLSDSSDPDVRAAELAAWSELRDRLGDRARIYYRWRQRRTKRKAGNVADFCRRWGRDYRYMVVLDADSVMSGDCLTTLVRLMEAHPKAGIIQTAPQAVGHATLHARAQQFASRVAGRLFTLGMQYWQLGESHYWGHNAIIRVEPFMKHCGLAPLKGREIMSHDFVEAALMRRAGYEVWLVGDLQGSYEQQPPNLIEELHRDRRWCQGNLQNAGLIAEPGLHGVHRAMLFTGVMAYLSAPLWLAFMLLGGALWFSGAVPNAVVASELPRVVMALWAATLTMLVLPRVLGIVAILLRREQRFHGGTWRLIQSAMLEAGLSMLQAPVRMVAHTLFVLGPLTGVRIEWKSPPRKAESISWKDAARRFAPIGLAALAVLSVAALLNPTAMLWLMPVAVPLVLAVPMIVLTSKEDLGEKVRRRDLLVIPEEAWAPAVLRRAWAYAKRRCREVRWVDVLLDDRLFQTAVRAVGPRRTGAGLRALTRERQLQEATAAPGEGLSREVRLRALVEPYTLQLLRASRETWGWADRLAAARSDAPPSPPPHAGVRPARA